MESQIGVVDGYVAAEPEGVMETYAFRGDEGQHVSHIHHAQELAISSHRGVGSQPEISMELNLSL